MMPTKRHRFTRHVAAGLCILALLVASLLPCAGAQPARKRYLMTHYMPWFQAKPFSGSWGWHWTMNHYDPDHIVNGRRDAPSHYYPLIGLYDSDDPDALRCQVMLMKLAGIDGVLVDWYGNDETQDYGINNRNTLALVPFLRRAGLSYGIVYETQTVPNEIKSGFLKQDDIVPHGQRLMQWMQDNFFSTSNYLKLSGRPVLLSFGDPYYDDAQWDAVFSVLATKPLYFTEGSKQRTSAIGGFDWPLPAGGTQAGLAEVTKFYDRAKDWPYYIPTAFPRFDDIYAQAGVGKSWGHIDDQNGQTYSSLLDRALRSDAQVIQLVTWNDWGEGTQIEPSVEFGYRDLEATQQARRKYLDHSFPFTAKDLRLPVRWYELAKAHADDPAARKMLDTAFDLVADGKVRQARAILSRMK